MPFLSLPPDLNSVGFSTGTVSSRGFFGTGCAIGRGSAARAGAGGGGGGGGGGRAAPGRRSERHDRVHIWERVRYAKRAKRLWRAGDELDGGVAVAYVVMLPARLGSTRLVDRELDDGLTRLFNAVKSKVQGKPAWCALANAPTGRRTTTSAARGGRLRSARRSSVGGRGGRAPSESWIVKTPARSTGHIDAPGSDNVVVGINEGIVVRDGMVVVMDAPRLPHPAVLGEDRHCRCHSSPADRIGLFGYAVLNAGPRRPPEVGFPAALSFAGVVVFFLCDSVDAAAPWTDRGPARWSPERLGTAESLALPGPRSGWGRVGWAGPTAGGGRARTCDCRLRAGQHRDHEFADHSRRVRGLSRVPVRSRRHRTSSSCSPVRDCVPRP